MRRFDEKRRRQTLGLLVLAAGSVALSGQVAGGAPRVSSAPAAPPPASAASSAAPLASASAAPVILPPSPLDLAARHPAKEIDLAPAKDGTLGAWLLVGPYRARGGHHAGALALKAAPEGLDEKTLAPRADVEWPAVPAFTRIPPRWEVVHSNEGPIDVAAALHTKEGDLIAYAAGTLHVEKAGTYHLLLGADDGVMVSVDSKPIFLRDEARPQRDGDDLLTLDLASGDHPIVLKLHQRDAAWAFSVRFVDANYAPPEGAYLSLPGTSEADAKDLAWKMSWVSVDRGMIGTGYAPKLTVRYPEGMPRGVPVKVRARLVPSSRPVERRHGEEAPPPPPPAVGDPVFDVDAGEVPIDAQGAGELVVALPQLHGSALGKVENHDWAFEVDVGGRVLKPGFYPLRAVREAVGRAEKALASLGAEAPSWLVPGLKDSVLHVKEHLTKLVGKGDYDEEALATEAAELDALAASLEKKEDPYAARTGPMRRAHRSPTDGELAEFGLYVPAKHLSDPDCKFPLIVGLHGMNGNGMSMLRWLFGYDDPTKDSDWENRHMPADLPTLDAFVITPDAYGNTMYRDFGEDDVMRVVDWAMKTYPIDPQRVSITGPSMGGIGAASIPFHYPGTFSAAAPLCGYHSYAVRRDYNNHPVRPWERLIAEERSNTSWAYNAYRMPVWIVHGKKDLPEANSKVLIDALNDLGYWVKHDHPDLGHNVWQDTYQGLKGAHWLTWHKKDLHPKTVRLKTLRPRYSNNLWVHIEELSAPDQWGQVQARARSRTEIEVQARGIAELRLDRDPEVVEPQGPLTVRVDGQRIVADTPGSICIRKSGDQWTAGHNPAQASHKHDEITGPLRDVFHSPVVFVYGTQDPSQTRINEEVARSWAKVRWGVSARFPVMSDAEFFAQGEPLANDRALFLVGNAKSNRVVKELEPDFPIKIDGDAVVIGTERITGKQLGAAFIRPNPRRPDRYVVVVEGTTAEGTWRLTSLPDLLPDFIVYDEAVAPARGQQLLSAGAARAAGFFKVDWSLPADLRDPSAREARPGAQNEHDATAYLP